MPRLAKRLRKLTKHPKRPLWQFIFLALLLGSLFVGIFYLFTTSGATYTGTLPCADCPGIDATIVLYRDGTFTQTYKYREKNTRSILQGTWKTRTGTPSNPSAIIYALTPGGTTSISYYAVQENQLVPLDSSLKELPAPYNAPLIKQTVRVF